MSIKNFINKEASGGLVLIVAAILAMIVANSDLGRYYHYLLDLHLTIQAGSAKLDKSIEHWINDGLMTIFFFLIGLELKREFLVGHLKDSRQIVLPAMAAIGGVIAPILIYLLVNHNNPAFHIGWAIPMATDIAFALGVMSLFDNRISRPMKVFLLTLAITDDLLAIIVIAIFHTHALSWYSLLIAAVSILALLLMNICKVRHFMAYLTVGLILWVGVLKSGVHATLAGVILALFIPMQGRNNSELLQDLENNLHPYVTYLVLPLFAFANTGVELSNVHVGSILHGIPLGIALGLFIGKPLGILSFIYVTQKMTKIPINISWRQVLIIGMFAGIGFTMSLFIGALSFAEHQHWLNLTKLGIILGSLLSILMACLMVVITHHSKK